MSVGINNRLRTIFNHYEERTQLVKLAEELHELLREIYRIECSHLIDADAQPRGNDNFQGELADVLVLCNQFRLKYKKIDSIMDYKINRQIGRIKDEHTKPL